VLRYSNAVPKSELDWYEVGDLDFVQNNSQKQVCFEGANRKNSVIRHVGTGRLFSLGDPANATSNANQDWNGFALRRVGITTKTGDTAVHIGWRFSGVLIEDCHIEGFSGYGISNIDPTDFQSNKTWSTTVRGTNVIYCGIGIANMSHACLVESQTKIYFCTIGFQNATGAACKIQNSDISACSEALIDVPEFAGVSRSFSLSIDKNYFEYGYSDGAGGPLIFGPDDPNLNAPERPLSLDGTHNKSVDPSCVFIRPKGRTASLLSITNNGIAGLASPNVIVMDMKDTGGTQHNILNFNMNNNSVSRQTPAAGTILTVNDFAHEVYESLKYEENYTSGGMYNKISNLDRGMFSSLQEGLNQIHPIPTSPLTYSMRNKWKRLNGAVAAYDDLIESFSYPVTVLTDGSTSAASEYEWLDNRHTDCVLRIKWYYDPTLANNRSARINRAYNDNGTVGTSIVNFSKKDGTVGITGSSAFQPVVLKHTKSSQFATAYIYWPSAGTETVSTWDCRPHTTASETGKWYVSSMEFYAEAPDTHYVVGTLSNWDIPGTVSGPISRYDNGAYVTRVSNDDDLAFAPLNFGDTSTVDSIVRLAFDLSVQGGSWSISRLSAAGDTTATFDYATGALTSTNTSGAAVSAIGDVQVVNGIAYVRLKFEGRPDNLSWAIECAASAATDTANLDLREFEITPSDLPSESKIFDSVSGNIETPSDKTITLIASAPRAVNVLGITGITSAGTLDANLIVDGVTLPAGELVGMSTTEATTNYATPYALAQGGTLQMVVSNNATAADFAFSIDTVDQ